MATMKTLSSVSGMGIKCIQTKFGSDLINRILPVVNKIQVRHGRYGSSPLVKDSKSYTGFEISRSPDEWKFVENLLPVKVIKNPETKTEYPSGWKPQNPPANSPYHIARTANHMLPVYMVRRGVRGQNVITRVRYVQGDVWALEQELRAVLEKVYPDELIRTQVNEVAGMVVIRGDYASACREYLLSRGW